MNYDELPKKTATEHLNSDSFVTKHDKDDDDDIEYRKCIKIGSEWGSVFINEESIWSYPNERGEFISSSECIGHHKIQLHC